MKRARHYGVRICVAPPNSLPRLAWVAGQPFGRDVPLKVIAGPPVGAFYGADDE